MRASIAACVRLRLRLRGLSLGSALVADASLAQSFVDAEAVTLLRAQACVCRDEAGAATAATRPAFEARWQQMQQQLATYEARPLAAGPGAAAPRDEAQETMDAAKAAKEKLDSKAGSQPKAASPAASG